MPAPKQKKPKVERFELLMSSKEKTAFLAASRRQGLSLAHWLRLAGLMAIAKKDGKVELVELD